MGMATDWQCQQCGSTERYGRHCRPCHRKRYARKYAENPRFERPNQLMKKYRLTVAQFDALLAQQGGACAICRRREPGGRWNQFVVDHDHDTGAIRGLLCDPCNRGLGFFQESSSLLSRAAAYLEAHNGR